MEVDCDSKLCPGLKRAKWSTELSDSVQEQICINVCSPVRRCALNTDVFQMTGSCSTVAASASRLDRAASKGTSWAAGSCFHVTSARTAQVSIVSCRVVCAAL